MNKKITDKVIGRDTYDQVRIYGFEYDIEDTVVFSSITDDHTVKQTAVLQTTDEGDSFFMDGEQPVMMEDILRADYF